MITRSQMRRQLRAKGGIMNISSGTIGGGGYTGIPMGSRTGFGIISKLKDKVRDLIPNEIANIAVKAAPFVAPFYPGYAAIARGLGRFDQRGSISDALKQGAATYAGGKAIGFLGGAQSDPGILGRQRFSMEGFKQGPVGKRLFKETPTLKDNVPQGIVENTPGSGEFGGSVKKIATKPREGLNVVKEGVDFVKEKIPMLENLPDDVAQKLLVGGITGGASALYSYFAGEFEPQQPNETTKQYLARRDERVKAQMRGFLDSYYTPLRNPQYADMTPMQKDRYIDSIVGSASTENKATGGRVGLMGGTMPTGIMRSNKAGVMERDYRDEGGFVPVGIKEKADDVPAMLSKNEFVFTADAVRGAGNGSVEKGAQKMYDTMKNLERRVT